MGLTLFLDKLDDTREARTQQRPEIWQMNGYRTEWNRYVEEWVDSNSDWQ